MVKAIIDEIKPYQKILSDFGFVKDKDVLSLILFFAAIHDIGKFSESFQSRIPELLANLQGIKSSRKYPLRHDALGQLWMDEILIKLFLKKTLSDGLRFDTGDEPDNFRDILSLLMTSSASHHGEPKTTDGTLLSFFTQENLKDAITYTQVVSNLLCISEQDRSETIPCTDDDIRIIGRLSWVITGLITISDWIASRSGWFEYHPEPMDLGEYWEEIAKPLAKKALRETGLLSPPVSQDTGMNHLFPDITLSNPMQILAESCDLEIGSHLILIEDLCGNGKTEAALVLAHRLMQNGSEGLFFALPTMATANAMFKRIQGFYERLYEQSDLKPHLELTHSASRVMKKGFFDPAFSAGSINILPNESDSREESIAWLSDSRKKALLAHVGIGTIDQALMGVLPIRHQSLRILGLCRNILIIDEVHSYDPYMLTLLCRLIEFQVGLGGSVILISATLPLSTRQELTKAYTKGKKIQDYSLQSMDYPLLTVISEQGEPKEYSPTTDNSAANFSITYEIQVISREREIIGYIREGVKSGLCIVWIRNTVSDAVETYQRLIREFGPDKTSLFHARFTLHDRLTKEKEVLERFGKEGTIEKRAGQILIATQVIEQSLDVDFDRMITDLAPIELMIQRAGRLHRHHLSEHFRYPDRGPARLIIFSPQLEEEIGENWVSRMFPKGSKVYADHGRLYLSLSALSKRKTVVLPRDLRPMIEEVYGKDVDGVDSLSRIPAGLMNSTLKEMGRKNGDASVGMMNALSFEAGYMFDGVKWADDAFTPTRLSELSIPVCFGKRDEGLISPLYSEGVSGWLLSQVMLPAESIVRSAQDGDIASAIKTGFPGRGRKVILMVMKPADAGWIGRGWNEKGEMREVRYNVIEGFSVQVGDKNDE